MVKLKCDHQTLKKVLRLVVKAKRVPAIWGPPGTGKSTIAKELASELNCDMLVLDAPFFQPFDYAITVPDHNTKTVQVYEAGFIPRKGPALVVIEDLPLAKTYQQVPLLQLALDRRIGNSYIADDVYFIVTGNNEEDFAGTNPLISPLLNRLFHFDIDVDADKWIVWAKSNNLHSLITGFIAYKPDLLVKLPDGVRKAFPTPRSWHALSDTIWEAEKEGELNESTLRILIDGSVGGDIASGFIAWFKYLQSIDPKDIVEKGVNLKTEDRSQVFAVMQSVAGLLKTKNSAYMQKFQNNLKNYFSSLQGEFKMAFLKELIEYKNDKMVLTTLTAFIEAVPESAQFFSSLHSA